MNVNDSILLFNKPVGWTSFDVVNKVKRMIRLKTGHAGTLDPLASGLLVLCTGLQTRQMEAFKEFDKEYTGTMVLGASTPSYDRETAVNQTFPTAHISEEMIRQTAAGFCGEKLQVPPRYSAKQWEGKRYYEYARSGETLKPLPSLVSLQVFEITAIRMPEIDFRIVCGKGFYVRSLVHDFGQALQSGSMLTSLCRTRVGPYLLELAWEIAAFEKAYRNLPADASSQTKENNSQ